MRFAVACLIAVACGGTAPAPPPSAPEQAASARPAELTTDEASWGKFHSKRFQLTVPLPDGRGWKVDDHSRPNLFAVHEATGARLSILTTQEDELVNRQKCEARARDRGWVPEGPLSTVEEHVTVGPDAYDSRIWVAVEARAPGGTVEGHVFLFGAFIRKCLLVHFSTKIASAKDEAVLSQRLALAEARIVRGLKLDPPRTSDEATVPRDKPDIRR